MAVKSKQNSSSEERESSLSSLARACVWRLSCAKSALRSGVGAGSGGVLDDFPMENRSQLVARDSMIDAEIMQCEAGRAQVDHVCVPTKDSFASR